MIVLRLGNPKSFGPLFNERPSMAGLNCAGERYAPVAYFHA